MKALHANTDNIKTVFSDTYIIPEYQRPYAWDVAQCEELWDDIENFHSEAGEDGRSETYFLGCITLYQDDNKSKEWFVIDGQQRLITLSLFIKALYEIYPENKGLLACLCQDNVNTRKIDSEKPRIVSKVLEGDNKGFKELITSANIDDSTILGKNYMRIKELVDDWVETNSKDPQKVSELITKLLTKVKILRIKSDSEEDALQIFETINNRGESLNAADIFKVQLCRNLPDSDQANFTLKWNDLESPWFLFTMYMYILRAQNNDRDTTRPNLKKYFKSQGDLFSNPDAVMKDITKIKDIRDGNWNMPPEIKQWWKVVEVYPNVWWQYPLYVFLFNRMEKIVDGKWDASGIIDDFRELIIATTRYLVIKGVNYRSIDRIKLTILSLCADIASNKTNYLSVYDNDLKNGDDRNKFKASIEDHNNFRRYQTILVHLNACLFENEFGESHSFHKNVYNKRVQIEHILPKGWNNYDGWNKETHLSNLGRLGNLMLLHKKVNIKSPNDFFNKKKDIYATTDFAEAKELAASDIIKWKPLDLQERDRKIKARIFKFLEIEN